MVFIFKPVVNYDIDKHTIIKYSFRMNKKIYSFYVKYFQYLENPYLGIEGVVSLFVPRSLLKGAIIKSNVPVDYEFYQNIKKIYNFYPKNKKNKGGLRLNLPIKQNEKLDGENNNDDNNDDNNDKRQAMTTFTLGVDSFYTLIKEYDQIDTLLYIDGFDIDIQKKQLFNVVKNKLIEAGNDYNKKIIFSETNLRNIFNKIKDKTGFAWGKYFHGPAIFCVFYGLINNYKSLYIPSSVASSEKQLWGTAWHIDNFYSSSNFNIIHNGDVNRVEKIKFLIENDNKFLDHLRVCFLNPKDAYNCSRCEKCLRTMIPIKEYGKASLAKTFDFNIDIGQKYIEIIKIAEKQKNLTIHVNNVKYVLKTFYPDHELTKRL